MIVSTNSKEKIYHEDYCPYVRKINKDRKKSISEENAIKKGYRPCVWCGGYHGLYLKIKRDPNMYGKPRKSLKISWDRKDRAMCFRTGVGFWKVILGDIDNNYRLFHLNKNCFDEEAPDIRLMRKSFHRQIDVSATTNFGRIVHYISEHDKAKRIIQEDWRKLPNKTPKQKKYFKQAKKRETKKQNKRIDELFKKLERGEL